MNGLTIEGLLWLLSQEGGFAIDAFMVAPIESKPVQKEVWGGITYLAPATRGKKADSDQLVNEYDLTDLADAVAETFGIERQPNSGDRYVGPVRITIERLENGEL